MVGTGQDLKLNGAPRSPAWPEQFPLLMYPKFQRECHGDRSAERLVGMSKKLFGREVEPPFVFG
jgi:hypothetical protein